VVVNPAALDYPDAEVGPLVLHEAVHAVTNACAPSYPSWVVEGLAESVASGAYPSVAKDDDQAARDYRAAHGMPERLPDAAEFAADPDSQRTFYALARVAVNEAIARLGEGAAVRMLVSLEAADEARVTTWYLDAMRALK